MTKWSSCEDSVTMDTAQIRKLSRSWPRSRIIITSPAQVSLLRRAIEDLVARTNTPASQYGREISKHTTIVLQDTQGSKLPEPQEKSLKDLAEYLLRNALFH